MTGLPESAFTTPEATEATGGRAWLSAMLDVERALATAAARVGLVDASSAQAVVDACRVDALDVAAIEAGTIADATPIVELVRQLRAAVPPPARGAVHVGATSQDVVDTAMVLLARRSLRTTTQDARAVADQLAALAGRHRGTRQAGRTLLQDGAVTTFGAHAATRLVAVDDAIDRVTSVARDRLCLQLGGAVGTLTPAGEKAAAYVAAVAAELALPEPVVPWHTSRGRVAELVSACAVLAGELAAVAYDVVLLTQTAIAELSVAHPGGSSAMAHKRNPASAVLAIACAHRTPGLVSTVLSGMRQELQRSAGAWQAEWAVVGEMLRLLAATADHTRCTLDGLVVDEARMTLGAAPLGADASPGAAELVVDRALAAHAERRRTTPPADAESVS